MARLADQVDSPAVMLIRPDGYIAWAADTFEDSDRGRLHAALRRWFGSPAED